jgi:hypothetical protein
VRLLGKVLVLLLRIQKTTKLAFVRTKSKKSNQTKWMWIKRSVRARCSLLAPNRFSVTGIPEKPVTTVSKIVPHLPGTNPKNPFTHVHILSVFVVHTTQSPHTSSGHFYAAHNTLSYAITVDASGTQKLTVFNTTRSKL